MTKISRTGECGSARLKFLTVMVVIGALAYAGYLFAPVAYYRFYFKDLMHHDVEVAATQGYPPSWVKDQLAKSEAEYSVPANALITPAQREGRLEVRVQFTQPIEFPGYTYQWEFDYTAKSTAFLTFK
jgi:hypothetical protein